MHPIIYGLMILLGAVGLVEEVKNKKDKETASKIATAILKAKDEFELVKNKDESQNGKEVKPKTEKQEMAQELLDKAITVPDTSGKPEGDEPEGETPNPESETET